MTFRQLEEAKAPVEFDFAGEVIAVVPVSASATEAGTTSLLTAIRTLADLQRNVPMPASKAIVDRGSREQVAAAEWMARHLLPNTDGAPSDFSFTMPPEIPHLSPGPAHQ